MSFVFVVCFVGFVEAETIFVDDIDTTIPTLESISPAVGEVVLPHGGTFQLTVDAGDAGNNLYKLEIDHSLENIIPEFSVYASEANPYGDDESKAEFLAVGASVTYDAATQEWNIDFGPIMTEIILDNEGITFYIVIADDADNQFGDMYNVIPEYTFAYAVETTFVSNNEGELYSTIQDAIDGTEAGGVITVPAGTYEEIGQIIINKDLTIIGEDKATTIIKPDHDTTAGYYLTTNAWFYIEPSTSFSLSGVTLDGEGRTIHTAIQSRGELTVEDCVVKNIYSSKYMGIGIQFLAGSNNSIVRCEFNNIQRIGIHVRGGIEPTNPTASIEDVIYAGKGVGDFLDYGIEFGGGGSGIVDNSNVSNNVGVASIDGSTSAGIYATDYYGTGTIVTVKDSVLTDNYMGIAVGYALTDETELTAYQNTFMGNTYGIENVGVTETNAENNWWGTDNGTEIKEMISGNVSYVPWYISEDMDVLIFATVEDEFSGDNEVSLDEEVLLSGDIQIGDEVETIEIIIPADTIIRGESSWTGEISVPTINEVATVAPSRIGYTSTISKVIEVGFSGVKLEFNKAVKITIPGEANKIVGYSYDGATFYEITTECLGNNETWNSDNLPAGGDCYLSVGDDLIVWTKHFTEFVTYTETKKNPSSGGGSSSSGSPSGSSIPILTTNVSNETEAVNETFAQGESSETIIQEESVVDRGLSLITGAVTGLNDGSRNSNIIVGAVGVVLILSLLFIFQGGLPGTTYFKRAAIFHKRAEKAHLSGEYTKARKLYDKSYSLREKGEKRAFRRAGHGAV